MKPDGSDVKTVVPAPSNTRRATDRVNRPHWSRDATHVGYEFTTIYSYQAESRFYRVAADGSGATDLSGGLSDCAFAIGWCAE